MNRVWNWITGKLKTKSMQCQRTIGRLKAKSIAEACYHGGRGSTTAFACMEAGDFYAADGLIDEALILYAMGQAGMTQHRGEDLIDKMGCWGKAPWFYEMWAKYARDRREREMGLSNAAYGAIRLGMDKEAERYAKMHEDYTGKKVEFNILDSFGRVAWAVDHGEVDMEKLREVKS